MYTIAVKDHILIAHSLKGECFGPAQGLHGATYHVTAEFEAEHLDKNGIVIDIGLALRILHDCLAPLNYQNLDTIPAFAGHNSTTEFLAAHIHATIATAVAAEGFRGRLKVILEESHLAYAAFSGPVPGPGSGPTLGPGGSVTL
jgi:6-pyruvoyl-tetrahydropterin synthase